MSSAARPFTQSRQVRGLFLLAGLIGIVWLLSNIILSDDTQLLAMTGMGIALAVVVLFILKDWRSGFFLFIFWLLFEDLARKYLGNNMVLYFGKDVLVAITWLSLYLEKRKGRVVWFKPPFMVPLALFFGLALVQIFNPYTPSFLYGVLGLKLYFYYAPLMFIGYALLRTPKDLNRFLLFNVFLGFVIAALGIVQSIVGLSFLNPAHLAPELQDLGDLTRFSPITHTPVPVPTSVFVSGGRFSSYMVLVVILGMGTQGLLMRRKGAIIGFLGIGLAVVGAMESGSRGAIIYTVASILIVGAGLLWDSRSRRGQRGRMSRTVAGTIAVGAIGLFLMVQVFPDAITPVWTFYSETLSPNSPSFELTYRAWDYPIENLEKAFEHEHWFAGRGTGTASLGTQYISALVGPKQAITGDVETGYGSILVEMGLLGPILWLVWTTACLYYEWKTVQLLRRTPYFSVGVAIFWYSFLLLVPFTFASLTQYENFVLNAYFWLLVGVLFRLPHLARLPQTAPESLQVRAAGVPVPAMAAGR